METTKTEEIAETVQLADEPVMVNNFTSISLARKLLSIIFFLTAFLIACVIPIVQLIIGLRYGDDCIIDEGIQKYLVVVGGSSLAIAGLALFLFILHSKCDQNSKERFVYRVAKKFSITAICILLCVMFFYFFFGCIWVFANAAEVQFTDQSTITYCHPAIYKAAFATLILTAIWPILMCSSFCIMCCVKSRNN